MATYSNVTDKELLSLLKEGDEIAFRAIFDRYHSLLYQFAYKKIHDRDEAKDIVQEVFVNLWNNRAYFELKTSLDSYLCRSVLNKVLNIIKHQVVHDAYIHSLQKFIDGSTQSSDYLIIEKDIEKAIAIEIAALPTKMREVFELRRKSYMTNKQIAEKLNISEQTVETHMKRALRVLRMRLGILICLLYFFN